MNTFLRFLSLLCLGMTCPELFGNSARQRLSLKSTKTGGNEFDCSFDYCMRSCSENTVNWCYTFRTKVSYACQGWCAWTSSKTCNKKSKAAQKAQCRAAQPYWLCQTSYGGGWKSAIATGAKWISPDILNEHVTNESVNTITFNGNIASSTEKSTTASLTGLWYPMGELKMNCTTFYWNFYIRQLGASATLQIGISDISKIVPGSKARGLFYGGNTLSDGSDVLVGNFHSKLRVKDKLTILVKVLYGRIKMYVSLNDEPIVLAFDVPENTLYGIYPVVKFTGHGSVEIEEKANSDTLTELEPVKPFELEGSWTLQALGADENPANKVKLKLKRAYGQTYKQHFKFHMYIINRFVGNLYENTTSKWFAEIVYQTNDRLSPKKFQFECKISTHIFSIKKVFFDGAKKLILDGGGYMSLWKKIDSGLSVVNWNPFIK